MAISNGNPLNKPRVIENESDLEDSGGEVEFGNDKEAELEGDCKMEFEDGDDLEDDNILNQVSEEKCNVDKAKDIAQEDIASGNKKEGESAVNYSVCDDFKSKSASDQAVVYVKSTMKSIRVVEDTSDESEMDSENANDSIDDFDDDDSDKDSESDKKKDKEVGSRGLANVMAKILATKKSENVILSKAKKKGKTFINEAADVSDDSFEVVDDSGKVKKEPKFKEEKDNKLVTQSAHERELLKKIWERKFRVKPDIKEDREKERRLKVLATQGVVQLFSAIEKHKNMVQKKLSETRSVMEREKILEKTGKEAFLEVLRQQGKKVKVSQEEEPVKQEIKDEPVEIPAKKKPRWNVLADSFYKEPTLKSWDQQSDDDD